MVITKAGQFHSNHSDSKRTRDFDGHMQVMIDNVPCRSISGWFSIKTFGISHTKRERAIFCITGWQGQRGRTTLQNFLTKSRPPVRPKMLRCFSEEVWLGKIVWFKGISTLNGYFIPHSVYVHIIWFFREQFVVNRISKWARAHLFSYC